MVKLDKNAVLEYATFKVPYEELNLEFRRGHKNMERVGAGLKRSIAALRSALSEKDGCVSVATAREAFRDFKLKLEQLDMAKKEAVRKQRQFIKNMQMRIQFLRNEDISHEKAQRELEMWRRDRQQVARLICSQMLRCGHVESAKALANATRIISMTDEILNRAGIHIDEMNRIRLMDPEISDTLGDLRSQSRDFAAQMTSFRTTTEGLIKAFEELATLVEAEKLRAMAARSAFQSADKTRSVDSQQLQIVIRERQVELERLRVELASLQAVEQEQKDIMQQIIHG